MLEDIKTASACERTIHCLAAGDPAGSAGTLLQYAITLGVDMWWLQLEAFVGWCVLTPAFPGSTARRPASMRRSR